MQRAQNFLEAEAGLHAHVQNVEMRANTIKAECEERIRCVRSLCVRCTEQLHLLWSLATGHTAAYMYISLPLRLPNPCQSVDSRKALEEQKRCRTSQKPTLRAGRLSGRLWHSKSACGRRTSQLYGRQAHPVASMIITSLADPKSLYSSKTLLHLHEALLSWVSHTKGVSMDHLCRHHEQPDVSGTMSRKPCSDLCMPKSSAVNSTPRALASQLWVALQAEQEARSKVEGQSLSIGQLTATLHAQAAQVLVLRVSGSAALRCRCMRLPPSFAFASTQV